MSFFDDASLAFLPSGAAGKDGKAYSIKPTDGTGDFTFSRGSNLAATRVGADGLIEKGRENLFTQSNTFSSSDWNKTRSIVTGGQTGYDGSSDAWLFQATGNTPLLSMIKPAGVTTLSIYAKSGNAGGILLRVSDGSTYPDFNFNLDAGTTNSTSDEIDTSATDVGNGWYRLSLTTNVASATYQFFVRNADGSDVTTGANIYIQDAQLEIGLAATDYIESGATTGKAGLLEDEPRFDYSGGATCPSLLLEPSRTNLIKYSEYLTGTAGTSTFNEITSPEGVDNGLLFVENTATTTHGFLRSATIPTNPSAVDYTISIFAKKKEREYIQLTFFAEGVSTTSSGFNLINGTTSGDSATHKIEDYGNGWYRCSFTASILQSTGAYNFSRVGTGSDEFTFYYTGDGTSGVYFYGFQVEAGSYPTSYIPNHSGGSVTRGDELGEIGDYIGSTITFGPTDDFSIFYDGEIFERDVMFIGGGNSTLNGGRIWIRDNQIRIDGTTPSISLMADTSEVIDLNTRFKLLVKRNGATIDFFLDGSKLTTTQGDTDATFVINSLFWSFNNGYIAFGKHKQMLVFDSALSDADCITLTT